MIFLQGNFSRAVGQRLIGFSLLVGLIGAVLASDAAAAVPVAPDTVVAKVAESSPSVPPASASQRSKLAGFTYSSPLAGIGQGHDLSDILKSGVIRVGILNMNQPLFFSASVAGDLSGYSIDMARSIAKSLGVAVVINQDAKNAADLVNLLSSHAIDVAVYDVGKDLTIAKKVLYTDPDLVLYQSLLINRVWLAKQHADFLQPDDFMKILNRPEVTLGVLSGTTYAQTAKDNFPQATIKTYATWQDMFGDLQRGLLVVLLHDDLQIKKVLQDDAILGLDFKAVVLEDRPDLFALAAASDAWTLWQWLNQYIEKRHKEMDAEGILHYQAAHD